jgi:hypothetical protein
MRVPVIASGRFLGGRPRLSATRFERAFKARDESKMNAGRADCEKDRKTGANRVR